MEEWLVKMATLFSQSFYLAPLLPPLSSYTAIMTLTLYFPKFFLYLCDGLILYLHYEAWDGTSSKDS
jgi:hypothetical protein